MQIVGTILKHTIELLYDFYKSKLILIFVSCFQIFSIQ